MNYQPFLTPLPLWSDAVWPWLIVPLAAAVSVVYKAMKCHSIRQVPREAAAITFWILFMMVAAGAILTGLVKLVDR